MDLHCQFLSKINKTNQSLTMRTILVLCLYASINLYAQKLLINKTKINYLVSGLNQTDSF